MSAYREPYVFSAGVLALTVHLLFFGGLYLGVRWQSRPPEVFIVDMWADLPEAEVVPAPAPPPAAAEPAPQPKAAAPVSPPVKAEIELREKTKKKTKAEEKPVRKNEKKEKATARARRDAELEAYTEQRRENVQAQVRAETQRATQVQVERYQDLIRNKIRRKMKLVADVPETAEAVFKVTLLPDGMLMDDPVLVKSSGYPAYDEAAERAILAAEPLPVPDDVSLQKMFRELELKIRP